MSQILERISRAVRREIAIDSSDLASAFNRAIDSEIESQGSAFDLGGELEIRRLAENNLFGFGKLQPLLENPAIEEIWINSNDLVFVAEAGVSRQLDLTFDDGEIASLIEKMLRPVGRRLDRSSPFVDASLADGSRLHVVIPDITRSAWAVNIRKFPSTTKSIEDLVSAGTLSLRQSEYLSRAMRENRNILISGATQSGKTTMLCALLSALRRDERIVSVEDTFEIRASQPDWVAMQTRQSNLEGKGEVSLRRLIKEALRMRPTRLVVGEVREAEALDLLIALNSGIPGICTIHANSAQDAILKLATLPLLAGQNISMEFTKATVATCLDVVVHCELRADGKRMVSEIRNVLQTGSNLASELVEC